MKRQSFMEIALEEARQAADRGEVPVGAVLAMGDQIIAQAGNRTLELKDPTAHAEILVIRAACETLGSERLPGSSLYVTLEPCPMCAAAISFARIETLYYGAGDVKGGAVENGVRLYNAATCHHRPDVYSALAETESATLLRTFFKSRR
ncbi:nucleoside deaminase [Coralliovum pocilloporae]|uniref:nucleoside deaminase n=1 Tax=Coralliovum pocilloporae TaxID=3066369 RepID=UPI003306EF17